MRRKGRYAFSQLPDRMHSEDDRVKTEDPKAMIEFFARRMALRLLIPTMSLNCKGAGLPIGPRAHTSNTVVAASSYENMLHPSVPLAYICCGLHQCTLSSIVMSELGTILTSAPFDDKNNTADNRTDNRSSSGPQSAQMCKCCAEIDAVLTVLTTVQFFIPFAKLGCDSHVRCRSLLATLQVIGQLGRRGGVVGSQ